MLPCDTGRTHPGRYRYSYLQRTARSEVKRRILYKAYLMWSGGIGEGH